MRRGATATDTPPLATLAVATFSEEYARVTLRRSVWTVSVTALGATPGATSSLSGGTVCAIGWSAAGAATSTRSAATVTLIGPFGMGAMPGRGAPGGACA